MNDRGDGVYAFGRFVLNTRQRAFLRDGEPIHLERKVFETLKFLVGYAFEHPNEVVTRDQIKTAVWGATSVGAGSVDRNIHEVRDALGESGDVSVATVPGVGFIFHGEVKDLDHIRDEDCPWVGLRPVEETQAKYLYGRDGEIAEIIERLDHHNFIAITSSSGIGKSSLVLAGLIPALKNRAESNGQNLVSLVFTPKKEPLRQLAELLLSASGTLPVPEKLERQIDVLRSEPEALKKYLERAAADQIVLVVDQFEELTLCEDPTEQEAFVGNLVSAVTGLSEKLKVVITLRVDLYGKFQVYPNLWTQLSRYQYGITTLLPDQLRDAIEKPAELVNLRIDDGLVDEILTDLGHESAAVALLSHTMAELFRYREGVRLTLKGYQLTGGVGRAIGKHADRIYENFSDSEQEFMRNIMIELTRVGDKPEHDVRSPKALKQLVGEDVNANDRERVIEVLVNERLLFKGESPDELVEICHEALIQQWSKLRRWLDDGRDALRRFERLREDAHDWERDRDPTLLYRAAKLKSAESAIRTYSQLMKPLYWEFIKRSEDDEKRRRLRKKRVIAISIIGCLTILAVVGLMIDRFRKRRDDERRQSESRTLASQSIVQLSNDPELSLVLAVEAGKVASTRESAIALRRALMALDQRAVYVGHKAQVISVNVSPDGRSLLTAGADRDARIWDIAERTTKKVFHGHTDWVNWAAYNLDGTLVITAGRDGQIRIWDVTTAETVRIITGHNGSVQNAVFSSDGKRILSAGEDGTVRLWDAVTGEALLPPMKGHSSWINTAVFSPDEKLIASAGGDGTVGIWDSRNGQKLKGLLAHQGTVIGVAFDRTGRRLLSAGSDKVAKIWDVATWHSATQFVGHTGPVFTAEFSRDGQWILTASKDGTSRVWDAASGLELKAFRGHRSGVNSAVFSADGNFAYTASGDSTVRMWAIPFGQRPGALPGHRGAVVKTTFSRDGRWIGTASQDTTVRIWNTKTLQETKVFYHSKGVEDVSFSPDGEFIATASDDGEGRICNVAVGSCRNLVRAGVHQDYPGLTAIAFSNDGSRIVTGAVDGTIQVWEASTGHLVSTWQAHKAPTTQNPGAATLAVAVSPRDEYIASSGNDNVVRLWNVANNAKEAEWDIGTGAIYEVAFSLDGLYVLGACKDQTARVWSIIDKGTVAVLRGHDKAVVSATFGPDSALVLTASQDRTTRLWDVGANEMLSIFAWNNSEVTAAAFSPDGRSIVVADRSGGVQLYSCDVCAANTSELLRIAQNRATRELTSAERQRFLIGE